MGFQLQYSAVVEAVDRESRLAVDPSVYIRLQPSKKPMLNPEPEVLIVVLASQ